MATGGLNSWSAVIVTEASGTGDIVLQNLAPGKLAKALIGTAVIAGSESSTTAGEYTIERSSTTAAAAMIFIL